VTAETFPAVDLSNAIRGLTGRDQLRRSFQELPELSGRAERGPHGSDGRSGDMVTHHGGRVTTVSMLATG